MLEKPISFTSVQIKKLKDSMGANNRPVLPVGVRFALSPSQTSLVSCALCARTPRLSTQDVAHKGGHSIAAA